jgi:hypothetical protein
VNKAPVNRAPWHETAHLRNQVFLTAFAVNRPSQPTDFPIVRRSVWAPPGASPGGAGNRMKLIEIKIEIVAMGRIEQATAVPMRGLCAGRGRETGRIHYGWLHHDALMSNRRA